MASQVEGVELVRFSAEGGEDGDLLTNWKVTNDTGRKVSFDMIIVAAGEKVADFIVEINDESFIENDGRITDAVDLPSGKSAQIEVCAEIVQGSVEVE